VGDTGHGTTAKAAAMESYYTIMKLPEEKKEEFILMIPITRRKGQPLGLDGRPQ